MNVVIAQRLVVCFRDDKKWDHSKCVWQLCLTGLKLGKVEFLESNRFPD